MYADKYLSIFSRQMEAIVYLYHAREIATIKLFLVVLEKRNQQDLAIFLSCFLIKQLFYSRLLDVRSHIQRALVE